MSLLFSQVYQRCTRVIRNTNDPVWIHNFTFENLVLDSRELEVAVFDYFQNKAVLIGEVRPSQYLHVYIWA